ncbi:DUF4397 domain-containing protein [Microbacterium sp. GCS4]|uniref:DUF4397 domain-containing protein n=1 Tax=Microbacterium sp. GCS4 TaxID=1692239 RepID=UPI000681FA37|nr:DUF4397 domain-containing protein [Microbacterium sp. GCS4]KNY06875.1 hypothetical protein AKH00_00610 [Microbacterium sp. GCS4]
MNTSRFPHLKATLSTGAVALLVSVAAPLSASAADSAPAANPAPAAVGADAGWLRLGHLSPDTKSVDVRVAAVSGGSTLFELDGVSYGDVSTYQELPAGTYTVSMVPAGASDSSAPVISETVTVDSGTATTVAAYGPTKDLQVRAFDDDLTEPAAGSARIRLIQASTLTPEVDVTTAQGDAIARDAKAGSATGYAEIPAGDWSLDLTGEGVSDTADVSVAAGSVTTLFVLDTSSGGLTILPILDSASVGDVPDGGVDTGGGFLASASAGGDADDAAPTGPAKRLGGIL